MKTNNILRFAPLAVLTLLAASANAQTPLYQITDLGSLGGGFSQAYALNNKGQVVGDSITADGRQHPFLYSNGKMQDLGSLSTIPMPGQESGLARGINDSGQVVGQTNDSADALRGFVYSNGVMQPLVNSPGNPQGINNAGQIVGFGSGSFLYQNGQTTNLGGYAAYAINNSGQIVGDVGNLAFLYQNGQLQALALPTGAYSAEAYGLNENGLVVGAAYYTDGTLSPFVWQNGQAVVIGGFARRTASLALGVNNSGVIVGAGPVDPFVYQNGQTYDLFAGTDWSTGEARAINNAGQIVGYGYHNGVERAFLATPNAVPEPGCLLTFGAGIGAALLAARRRKRRVLA